MKTAHHCLATALLLVILLWVPGLAQATAFQNGDFELFTGSFSGSFVSLGAGNTQIDGWTVGGNGIDYISTYWTAASGGRSLDLNATSPGSIFQTFDTVNGASYKVSFMFAGNPEIDQGIKTMHVTGGNYANNFTFDTTGGNLVNGIAWTPESFIFTATGNSTTLTFASADPQGFHPCGPTLDDVKVNAVPLPPAFLLLGSGLLGLGLLRRRGRREG